LTYPNSRYSDASLNRNRFDTWNPKIDHDGDAAGLEDVPPFRPFNFGPDKAPGAKGVDDDNDGIFDNISELGWPGTDDQPEPLRAIQIKITFFDPASQQVREVTLVQSL